MGRLKNEMYYGREWKGVGTEEFCQRLDGRREGLPPDGGATGA